MQMQSVKEGLEKKRRKGKKGQEKRRRIGE